MARRGSSLESELLILAALFLWINFFLAALSAREIAASIFSLPPPFLARRTATSSLDEISLFTKVFLFEDLKALLAVFVTGIQLATLQFSISKLPISNYFNFLIGQLIIKWKMETGKSSV